MGRYCVICGSIRLFIVCLGSCLVFFQVFVFVGFSYYLVGVVVVDKRIFRQDLLVVKFVLGEGLVVSVGSQISSEVKGFIDRQVCFDYKYGGIGYLGYMVTFFVQDIIDVIYYLFRILDFYQIDRFYEGRLKYWFFYSFFIMFFIFLVRLVVFSWFSFLVVNLVTYIFVNCFRVKVQLCRLELKFTVFRTGLIMILFMGLFLFSLSVEMMTLTFFTMRWKVWQSFSGFSCSFSRGSVYFVYYQDGFDAFSDGLAQYNFCLYIYVRYIVYYYQSFIGDT